MIKFIAIIFAFIASMLSMNFLAFKVYHWFKPFTGEYFSEILPDLSFWQIFALIMVMRYITGVAGSTSAILSSLSRVTKKDSDDTDMMTYLGARVLMPWGALLLTYLIKIIVF